MFRFAVGRGSLPDWVGKPTEKFPVGAIQMARPLKRYAAFGRRCRQRAGRLLDHMSTAETARDMDLAAGRARHTTDYLGVSSGTFVRATYANLSPNLVRAMVVDGNLNPAAWASREQGAFPGGAGTFRPRFPAPALGRPPRKMVNVFVRLCGRASTARYEVGQKSASKIGSSTSSVAIWTILSRRAGMPSFLTFPDPRLGI
jgi:pimeloyl-ACP methyl ester carboxylesterase